VAELNVTWQYPFNDKFDYIARLERRNLDEDRIWDLTHGKGFIISEPKSIKKDLKDPNGIFSTKYGQTLQDINPFADRYKCECGHMKSRIHHGIVCPICKTKVKYVDDDFSYFGWMCLKDPYYVIHPNLYKSLSFFIGQAKLDEILIPSEEKDEDGFTVIGQAKLDPYTGVGMMYFRENFEEIMNYYLTKNSKKKEYYDDIMANKDKVFTQSIPVYTTHLRPYRVDGDSFSFEGTNAIYAMMSRLTSVINSDNLKILRRKKPKNTLLYDLQVKFNELYKELEDIFAGKKGTIRSLFGGRYNFSSRCVIVQDPSLRIDQVKLPYHALVELLQQSIINILQKSYNISYSEAYKIWYKAQIKKNQRVYDIIKYMIENSPKGLPLLINRNPSINYGSIMQMYCVGINDNFTMSIPLQILAPLAADQQQGPCTMATYYRNSFNCLGSYNALHATA
jgi:DNA-directed RNA polymerase beta' subunit